MMNPFTYYMPTRILFGAGRISDLASTSLPSGKRALIVIGAGGSMRSLGYLDSVQENLRKNNVSAVVYDRIQPNPVCEHVDEGASVAKENQCDFVIGLGGGSTIDSAKSIAVMATNGGTYWDYVNGGTGGGRNVEATPLPIVAVPTTAGTGTEADPWTVITRTETREKIGWGYDHTFPTLSIVDPELMLSVPPDITAHTGMDAFFHSVEAYLATVHQPASDHLALEAVNLITRYLPRAVRDGQDIEARTMLAWANTEAGICEALSSCISHHSLEHAVSAYYPAISHGSGLVMLSVPYFSFLAERRGERFVDLARAMGEDVDTLPDADRPLAFIAALRRLIRHIGLSGETLSAHQVKREDLDAMAKTAFDTMGGLFDVTPVRMTMEDVVDIFERAYS
jgi:alcohol dehydrogenase